MLGRGNLTNKIILPHNNIKNHLSLVQSLTQS